MGPLPSDPRTQLRVCSQQGGLALVDASTGETCAAAASRWRSDIASTLSTLLDGHALVACHVLAIVGGDEDGPSTSSGTGGTPLSAVLGVALLPNFFDALEQSRATAAACTKLMDYWRDHSWNHSNQAAMDAVHAAYPRLDAAGGSHEEGAGEEEAEGEDVDDSSALRDRVFALALPSDWHTEHGEPPGLTSTLYRYQRRALAWMLWRESLGDRRGGGDAEGCCDLVSTKSRLPESSLLFRRVETPAGLVVWRSPVDGRVRLDPQPPLPETSGGLLCDEMGEMGGHGGVCAARGP